MIRQRRSVPDVDRLDLPQLLATIHAEVRERFGRVADDGPAPVSAERIGMAVAMLDGGLHMAGSAHERVLDPERVEGAHALTRALDAVGDALWERIGRERSGNWFDSPIQLGYEKTVRDSAPTRRTVSRG